MQIILTKNQLLVLVLIVTIVVAVSTANFLDIINIIYYSSIPVQLSVPPPHGIVSWIVILLLPIMSLYYGIFSKKKYFKFASFSIAFYFIFAGSTFISKKVVFQISIRSISILCLVGFGYFIYKSLLAGEFPKMDSFLNHGTKGKNEVVFFIAIIAWIVLFFIPLLIILLYYTQKHLIF